MRELTNDTNVASGYGIVKKGYVATTLDKNYLELKKIGSNSIILSTGVVFKKLLKAGINPDFVIITDGNISVYNQIEGIEDIDIPLLYLSTVYYKILQYYKGKSF